MKKTGLLTTLLSLMMMPAMAQNPDPIEDALAKGNLNNSMEKNKVTLHEGAVLCDDQNTNGAGFRIGELNTEVGSTLHSRLLLAHAKRHEAGRRTHTARHLYQRWHQVCDSVKSN